MGPWLCSHGNKSSGPNISPTRMLQWGRGCVATEITFTISACRLAIWASMGPWLCSHGNPEGSGKSSAHPRLQWGRGCVATEIRLPPTNPRDRPSLQWGRGCVATEIRVE